MALKCVLCGLRVASRTELGRHKVIAHAINKPHTCDHCGKNFAGKTNLLMHVRLHTGERPYACSDCGKDYADYSNCLKHVRSQHTGKASLIRRNFCGSCRHHFTDRQEFLNHGCPVLLPTEVGELAVGEVDESTSYADNNDESKDDGVDHANFDHFLAVAEPIEHSSTESDCQLPIAPELASSSSSSSGQPGVELIGNTDGYTVRSRNKYLLTGNNSRISGNRRFPATVKREPVDSLSSFDSPLEGEIIPKPNEKTTTSACDCDLTDKLKSLKNHMDDQFNKLSRSMSEIDRKLDLILTDKSEKKSNEKWHFTIEKHSE